MKNQKSATAEKPAARAKRLQRQWEAVRDELNEIEQAKRVKKSLKLVGKCYRYRNCYSGPQSDADYWWLYIRVVGVSEDGWPRTVQFEIDRDGNADIKLLSKYGFEDYELISEKDWKDARSEFLINATKLAMTKPQ